MAVPVEFIGGPFDGHTQIISIPLGCLSDKISLPVSEHVFRLLSSQTGGSHRETSLAIYERQGLRYHFVGAVQPVHQ